VVISLAPVSPPESSGLPRSQRGRANPWCYIALSSLFGLAPGGGYQIPTLSGRQGSHLPIPGYPGTWWALTPPFHPCLIPGSNRGHRRSCFCGPIRIPTLTGRDPPSYGAPCPLELGLSSPTFVEATTRVPSHLNI